MIWRTYSWPWPCDRTPIRATLPVGWMDLARVEHLQAEDVELMRRPGPDDLGERADADAHQLAPLALLGLLDGPA